MMKRSLLAAAGLAGLAAFTAVSLPEPAKAWVVIGLPPVVFGAPVAPPPAYYYPPPAPAYAYPPGYGYGYAPPAPPAPAYQPGYTQAPPPDASAAPEVSQDTRPYGSMCRAGVYSCAAGYGAHVGDSCACSGIGAPSYGTVY